MPVGNAGNISSHFIGYGEYRDGGVTDRVPHLFGFQASGAAPIVLGRPIDRPSTIATAIRIGNPASWELAVSAARDTAGEILVSPGSRSDVVAAIPSGASQGDVFTLWTEDYSRTGGGYSNIPTVPVMHLRVSGTTAHPQLSPEAAGL